MNAFPFAARDFSRERKITKINKFQENIKSKIKELRKNYVFL